MTIPATEPVPLKMNEGGVLLVEGTRVSLDTVVAAYRNGESAEEIAAQYTSLVLADVYAVIAYFLHHTQDVDAYLRERAKARAELKQQNQQRSGTAQGLRERLLSRRPAGLSNAEVSD